LGDGVVQDGVVGITNSLGVERPGFILGLGEITHCPVPESPPGLYFPVRLGVVAASGSALRAGDVGDGCHQFAEEFRCIVGVEDVGGAAAKMQFIEESRYKGGGLAVGKRDENHCFSETINQGQGLCFTSLSEALALKVHSVARAGFVCSVGGEKSMCESAFTFFVFTEFAVFADAANIGLH
jgi:hypothetical protein